MTLGPLMVDLAGTELARDEHSLIRNPLVGGLILFARNFADREQVAELVAEVQSVRAGGEGHVPLLIGVDQEGGRVQRFRQGFAELPPLRRLGRIYDESPAAARKAARAAARVMAAEVLSTGVDFSFAPCVDIDRGLCDVIGDRAFHHDPDVVAELALAYMQGLRSVGMAAVAKHFPGHGGVTGDSHHVLPEDARPESDLLDDMRPYTTLIDAGLQGVMMAHIRYPAINPDIASFSAFWMQRVLREQLGFRGAIFSDDMSMEGANTGADPATRCRQVLEAGADMILICNDRASAEAALAGLEGYRDPAAHARLASMRSNRERYASAPAGSGEWQRDLHELHAALDTRPRLELDGNA